MLGSNSASQLHTAQESHQLDLPVSHTQVQDLEVTTDQVGMLLYNSPVNVVHVHSFHRRGGSHRRVALHCASSVNLKARTQSTPRRFSKTRGRSAAAAPRRFCACLNKIIATHRAARALYMVTGIRLDSIWPATHPMPSRQYLASVSGKSRRGLTKLASYSQDAPKTHARQK